MSPFTYEYPRPAVTVDVVALRDGEAGPEVLLIRRGRPPFEGAWALPGGFVDMDESLEAAAVRELGEETGLRLAPDELEQIGAFGDPDRDPRGRVIAVAFVAQVTGASEVAAGDDAAQTRWTPLTQAVDLAFDHDLILAAGVRQARPS